MGYSTWYEHGTRHEILYLIYYDTLLQNTTNIITKCDSCAVLLQNKTEVY